jgi:type II secretory pathway component PulJ|tara:strand:+ start:845 stop:1090 length:246 start_codon:yes stop_codon:yes gene_type:complete
MNTTNVKIAADWEQLMYVSSQKRIRPVQMLLQEISTLQRTVKLLKADIEHMKDQQRQLEAKRPSALVIPEEKEEISTWWWS